MISSGVIIALLAGAARADAPPPFDEEIPELIGASILVELRTDGPEGDPALEAFRSALGAVGAPATVVAPVERASALQIPEGWEVTLWLEAPETPEFSAWTAAARPALRALRKVHGRPMSIAVPSLNRAGEMALSGQRVQTILVDEGGRPRRATGPDYAPAGLILPLTDPEVPLTPASLDALARAFSEPEGPASRRLVVSLDALDATTAATQAELLADWLVGVAGPAAVVPRVARDAPMRATAVLAATGAPPSGVPLDREDLIAAATSLRAPGIRRLPRSVAALNPAECFMGLALALSAPAPEGEDAGEEAAEVWSGLPERVLLSDLQGPAEAAVSSLPAGGVPLSRAAVLEAAAALAPNLRGAAPSLVDVDGYTLTAAEFLSAMAGAVLGEDPIQVDRINDPDPFAEGLGWGRSGS